MSNNIVTQATTRVNVDGKQAEQELEALRKKAEQFKKHMFEAYNKGDQKGLEKARKELIAIEKEMGKVTRSSVDINKTLNNLSTTGYNDLRKTLVALNKEINKPYIRRGSEEYNNLARSMAQVRAEMARVRSEQGLLNNSNSSSKWVNSMQVFVGGLLLKGVSMLSIALKDGISKIRSFEKANVMLGSILGANKEQMKDLSASAIDLAKTSIYTASQVTDLQTELAKLGFTPNQIKDSQKHVLNLATALDAQLGPSAELVGATLKAFNADTKETEKYVDAMTEAANRSAIGFEYLATAMPIVAPVAKAFNFSLEDTLALLGNLSDSGFGASSAATALRNILLNLANSNGKLAIALGRPVKTLPDLIAGFKDLKEKGIDLATSLELTDARSVAAFQTFLNGADSILELRDSIEEAGGAADKMAKDQVNNLDGAIKGLSSSWESLILSFSNSSGPLKNIVQFLSIILEGIINIREQFKNPLDRSAYKEFLKQKEGDAEVEYSLKLRKGVTGESEGDNFENAVKSNFSIYKEILNNEISDLTKEHNKLTKEYSEIISENEKNLGGVGQFIPLYNMPMSSREGNANEALTAITKKLDLAKGKLSALNTEYEKLFPKIVAETPPPSPNPNKKDPKGSKANTERQEINNALRSIESKHQEEMLKLKQEYLDNDLLTEEEFNNKKLKLQDDFDDKKKQRLIEFSKTTTDPSMQLDLAKQIVDIDSQALDKKIADREKKQKDAYLKEQELLKWNEEETKLIIKSALDHVANEESKEYLEMMQRRANNLISEEAYQREMTKIQTKYLEERLKINGLTDEQIADMRIRIQENEINTLNSVKSQRTSLLGDQITDQMKAIDDALLSGAVTFGEAVMLRMETYIGAFDMFVGQVGDNLSGAMDNFTSAEEGAISRKYDREIALAKNNSKRQRKLEEEKEKEIAATKAKYADKQFAVSVAQITSSTAVAAMEAYKAMAGIPVVGPALGAAAAASAILYGASQISVAEEQRKAAKSNYWTGGYTPNGPKYGYAGNVHFGEFVANQRTRQNPTADAVLSVIDIAQKNNTESSLTAEDFITGLDYRERMSGIRRNDLSSTPPPLDDNPSNDLLIGVTMRMTDTIDRLEQRLDNLTAKVYFKGEGGIEEVTKKANRLDKNVSRNG